MTSLHFFVSIGDLFYSDMTKIIKQLTVDNFEYIFNT